MDAPDKMNHSCVCVDGYLGENCEVKRRTLISSPLICQHAQLHSPHIHHYRVSVREYENFIFFYFKDSRDHFFFVLFFVVGLS